MTRASVSTWSGFDAEELERLLALTNGEATSDEPEDKLRGKRRPVLNEALGASFEAFLCDACVNIPNFIKGAVYICMSSSEPLTLQKAFAAAGGTATLDGDGTSLEKIAAGREVSAAQLTTTAHSAGSV